MKVLVTGSAGFIGSHTAQKLLDTGHAVMGYDNINNYYDPKLKHKRLEKLLRHDSYIHEYGSLTNLPMLNFAFMRFQPTHVVHLAAQAGVRHSIDHPRPYIESNITGFFNILEMCRRYPVEHLVFASSSSVYGASTKIPFSIHDSVDHPVSLYAATKKSNELMAHTYSHLYKIPTTGLRFFTVYGPYDRPDMALQKFAIKMVAGEPIDVYNNGNLKRDYTYIDDIVEGVVKVVYNTPKLDSRWDSNNPDPAYGAGPYHIYNIGNNNPVKLMTVIQLLEKHLGVTADKNMMPMQPGEVFETYADVDDLIKDIDYHPTTKFEDGIKRFADWFKEYYCVN